MNQKERMLANLPYKAWLDGLTEEREACAKLLYAYNHLPPERWEERQMLLKDLLGKTGERVTILPPFLRYESHLAASSSSKEIIISA